MVNSYQRDRREILGIVIIWIEEKGSSSQQKEEHMEKTLSHEGLCQFQGAEGSRVWLHGSLHGGSTERSKNRSGGQITENLLNRS